MKNNNFKIANWLLPLSFFSFMLFGCERAIDELQPATFPVNHEVFIDGFSSGLNYAAFGGSVPSAFDVDKEITYNNTAASMKFEVPNINDPLGAYAGGAFFTSVGRDLSSFNALTFWIKASQAANIDVLGFGNDMGESKYQVTLSAVDVNTSWKKVIIPLPNPSKLTAERGMFFYSEGPENDKGYTFWIDEVKFEKIGTIAHPQYAVFDGQDIVETSFAGVMKNISGLSSIYNMPNGIDQAASISASYFDFASSNESIATVDPNGSILIVGGPGTAVITAYVDGLEAKGSLTIQSLGNFQHAPVPTQNANNVISIYSDIYTSVPVDYYNGYWLPYQETQSSDFQIEGDHILHYTEFNFVGIQFSSPTVDAFTMTYLHVDIYLPNPLTSGASMKIEIVDFGSGGTGNFTSPIAVAQAQNWISLDIPLTSFTGLSNRLQLAQIIFSDVNNNIASFYADNIYFYK